MKFWIQILALSLAAVQAGSGDLSSEEAKAARKLYIGKCAKCHKLYDPGRYTDPQWDRWMKRMGDKARLKPDQRELLARYIQETFRRPQAGAGQNTNLAVSLALP